MMRSRTPILAALTAILATGVPAWTPVSVLCAFGQTALPAPAPVPDPDAARALTRVDAVQQDGDVLITVRGDGRLLASAVQVPATGSPRLVLDFAGVGGRLPATTGVRGGLVRRVRVTRFSATPLVTRLVVDLTGTFLYKVRPTPDRRGLTITIGNPAQRARRDDEAQSGVFGAARATVSAARTPEAVATPPISVRPPTSAAARPARQTTLDPPRPEAFARDADRARIAAARQAPAPVAMAPPPPAPVLVPAATMNAQAMSAGTYSGHPISLDFQGVDLRAVLRTFAEVTGLNLVIDPGVKGTVDVTLRDVPWDQALDMILRANQLGYTVDGTIVRIAPAATFATEAGERRKQAEERLRELAVSRREYRTVRLSYASAKDLAALVKKTGLTSFGDVEVDENTNTMILYDIPDGLGQAGKLIAELDRPQPQVEIEARIIRTSTSTARELGLLWAFGGSMTPELGNTTNLAFPNSVRTGGTAGAVNTQQDNAFIKLGSINGAFNIDVALSALESEGRVTVMLRPRVVTQNNVKATITRGQEIPYTTLTAPPLGGGVQVIQPVPQVQFKTAALTLNVTPRITEANTVILDLDVDNGSPGQVELNGNRSINTQRVTTRVLVADQGTTVIGGINEESRQVTQDRTPGLHRLPLIGRLFRRDLASDEEGELLIFITPRILRDGGPVK